MRSLIGHVCALALVAVALAESLAQQPVPADSTKARNPDPTPTSLLWHPHERCGSAAACGASGQCAGAQTMVTWAACPAGHIEVGRHAEPDFQDCRVNTFLIRGIGIVV